LQIKSVRTKILILFKVVSVSSSLVLALVVYMVHEGDCVLIPAGRVLAQVHADQVREPRHILDLELLEFQVCVERTKVEGVLEGHRVLTGSFLKHSVIELLVAALSFMT